MTHVHISVVKEQEKVMTDVGVCIQQMIIEKKKKKLFRFKQPLWPFMDGLLSLRGALECITSSLSPACVGECVRQTAEDAEAVCLLIATKRGSNSQHSFLIT